MAPREDLVSSAVCVAQALNSNHFLIKAYRSLSSKIPQSLHHPFKNVSNSSNPKTLHKKKSTSLSRDHQMNLINRPRTHHRRTNRIHLHNNIAALHDMHPMGTNMLPTENGNLHLPSNSPRSSLPLFSIPSLITASL